MSTVINVILVKDVPGVGRFGQRKSVKAGFARNYLFPQLLALLSTPQNEAKFEALRKQEEKRRAIEKADAQETAKKIQGKTLKFKAKTHDEGKLYGSISIADLIAQLKSDTGVEIERKHVELEDGFKEIGEFDVKITLYPEVQASIKVEITAEKEK